MGGVALWCVLACAGAALGAGGAGVGEALLGAPARYDLESTLQLNDAARADREVGYKIRAALTVAPRWAAPDHTDYLLEFHLQSPKLYLRGKHVNADFMPYESVWDTYTDTAFYAHWSHGLIKTAYLDPSELPDVLNYKKAVLSLFQVQMLEGEHNETDVSGPCLVLYETISTEVFRKIKSRCSADEAGAVSSARRVARYTVRGGALAAAHAEELLAVGHSALGLKARSWHTLTRAAAPPPAAPRAAALPAALLALPAALHALPLALQPPPDDEPADEELEAALGGERAGEGGGVAAALQLLAALGGEGAGEGGGAEAAAAALQLLQPLRRANTSALLHLLHRDDMHDHLPNLCRLLGLTATRASHAAARDFLQLHARDPLLQLAHTYLAAFALSDRPDDDAVLEVLRLADEARAPPVAHAALLAAAAAAAPAPLARAARDQLARGLARCRDEPCRARALLALGNLRRADTADLLLEHAERAAPAEPSAALAALAGLRAVPAAALGPARLARLQALALQDAAALEVRAAALDLVVLRRAELPAPLARLMYALHARGPHELRRLLWQRVAALAPQHEELRALPALLEPALRGWDARAHGGTSSVLVRAPGWALGAWRAELQSVQVARAGLLRRGEVRLLALDDHGHTFDALTVEVWTRGLEAFGGGTDDASADQPDEPAEEPAGGLALSVAGARMPDIPLFNGQAELLGHVWAGTGSAATPVLRALRPLLARRGAVPLLGGAVARADVRAALALALDAQAQVSLWWRSARAELRLRAGLAAAAALRVRTAWGELAARADLRAAPRLRIAADLDFYSGVALCVRVSTEPLELARTVTLRAAQGARRLRVRRERTWRVRSPGRTLALGRPNDATCRTLRAADSQADADADADADAA